MKTWKNRVQEVYFTLNELKSYDEVYNIAKRCGYRSVEKLWKDNPLIGGSANPKDFGIVKENEN